MQKSLILAGAIALAPTAVYAQQISIIDLLFNDGGLFLNVQFTSTGFADPSTVCGTDVGCQETESTVYIHFDASGIATATCSPPGGRNSKHHVTLRSPLPVASAGAIGGPGQNFTPPNDQTEIGVTIGAGPPTNLIVAGAPDCPNSKWSEMITDLAFTTARISIAQGTTTTLATGQITCNFNPPTANGSVPENSYASAGCVPFP
jgi:hypothetical protein